MKMNGNGNGVEIERPPITEQSAKAEVPKLQPLRRPTNVTALALLGLLTLALFYTFYLARHFFLPLVLAWMLSLILKPAVRALKKIGLPEALGAGVLLLGVLAIFAGALLFLTEPATRWVEKAPQYFEQIEAKVKTLLRPAEKLSKAAAKVEQLTSNTENEAPKVEVKDSKLMGTLLNHTKSVVVLAVETLVLLYFFLAAGDVFMLKLVQILPRLKDKKKAVEIGRDTATGVSQYLVGMTMVNVIEGTLIGIGLWLLGMPNPLLWGVLACVANYVPYIGAMIAGSIVTMVAFVTFESTSHALAAPAIYFGVNFMDNFLAPFILGKRLVLNPLVVFLSVMFWGWIWGIIGVLLAVPITMTIKVLCDHIPSLAALGEFLSAANTEDPTQQSGKEPPPAPSAA